MPHATTDIVNGETSSSKTYSHLKTFPAVNDSIETFKSNPYGKKSIEIADGAYARLGKPVEPYLKTPYSYAQPYIAKADELGDKALDHVEGHFPIVKEKTGDIVEKAKSTALWPLQYLNNAWNDEYKKTAQNGRGPGITTTALALVSLELRIVADTFHYIADTLRPAQDSIGEYEKYGKEKLSQLQGTAEKKGDELKGDAKQLKGEAEKKADEVKGNAKQAKDDAQKKLQK